MAELKPCPFCGSHDAYMMTEQDEDGFGFFLNIKCGTCRAATGQHYVSHGNDCPQARAEVRAAWNRRASPSTAPSGMAQAAGEGQQVIYVSANQQCESCSHTGINDMHPTAALCRDCDWSGEGTETGHCPACNGALAEVCPECGGRYFCVAEGHVASPAAAPSAQPTDDISRAADFLEQYAGYIREVKLEDIERHPYLPELEAVAASLRAIGAAPSAQEPQAAEQSCVVHGLAHPCERCASEISPEVRKDFDAALFRAWANEKGYDIAHTYDTERSRWVFFNPMTADLWACWQGCSEVHEVPGNASTAPSAPAAPVVTADAVRDALTIALDGLDEIALAGMSGTGMESEEGMRDWHARQAWKFIGIAARTKEAARAAMHSTDAREEEK